MSYTPTTWAAGDTVTAAKLNKLEQGVASGGGVLVVNQTWDENQTTATLDKTWQEIHDADVVIVRDASDEPTVSWYPVVSAHEVIGTNPYGVDVWDFSNNQANLFFASSASGYPYYTA